MLLTAEKNTLSGDDAYESSCLLRKELDHY